MPPADEGEHKNFAKIVIFAKAWASVLAKAIVWAKALASVLAKAISSLAGMSKLFRPLF